MSAAPPPGRVSRRRVFYVAAFDPAGSTRYHRTFAEEAARSGYDLTVGPVAKLDPLYAEWPVEARTDEGVVHTRHGQLLWNDLVRRWWVKDEGRLLASAWDSLILYARRGILQLGLREAPLLALASAFPVIVSTLFLAIYAGLFLLVYVLAAGLAASLDWPWWTALVPVALLLLGIVAAWRALDRLVLVAWLARGMHFVRQAQSGGHAEVEARCEAFAQRIVEAWRAGDADEILVVGHSLGTLLASRTVGKALGMEPQLGRSGPRVALLTLGQMIPIYSMTLKDPGFAADYQRLVEADQVEWLDIGTPTDPGTACGLHPLRGSGAETRADRPLHLSPRFHKLLERKRYDALRRRPLDFHFQYIKAADVRGEYDWFGIVAGPRFLGQSSAARRARQLVCWI